MIQWRQVSFLRETVPGREFRVCLGADLELWLGWLAIRKRIVAVRSAGANPCRRILPLHGQALCSWT